MNFHDLPRRLSRRIARDVRSAASAADLGFRYRFAPTRRLTRSGRALDALRGRHAGRRIFVIGNGPSLTPSDLDLLKDEVTIASNGIFLMFGKSRFRPTYFTVEDPLVAEDRAVEIQGKVESLKLIPRDLRKWIPPSPTTIHLNFRREYDGVARFTTNFAREAFWGGTVTFLNLQLAYHLGASQIVLLGVDHNYGKADAKDHVAGTVITSQVSDTNHFDPSYFGPGYRWHDAKPERMEFYYREAERFLRGRGVAVVNATRGGRLEVFQRAGFDDLMKGPRPGPVGRGT